MYIITLCMYLSVIVSVRWLLEVLLQLMDVVFERRGHIARLEEDGISGCIGVTVSQEFFFSTERDVQHQLLPIQYSSYLGPLGSGEK